MSSEKVCEIIKLGQSWGMTNSEILECLHIVADEPSTADKTNSRLSTAVFDKKSEKQEVSMVSSIKNVASSSGIVTTYKLLKSILLFVCVLVLVLMAIYTAVMACCFFSPTLENGIGKVAAPMVYPTMRVARIALKPLADFFDISSKDLFVAKLEIRKWLTAILLIGPLWLFGFYCVLTSLVI